MLVMSTVCFAAATVLIGFSATLLVLWLSVPNWSSSPWHPVDRRR